MEGMVLHRGGEIVTKETLDLIPLPQETDSYIPVSHYHLADKLLVMSQDILKDYTLIGENYAIARQGNQMFAVLKFKEQESNIGLSVAFRNSYDRSMSLGIAIGASVFICDNLSLTGEIVVMKKHTKNVWCSLEDLAISTLYKSQRNFQQICADSETMRGRQMNDQQAFALMGNLFGNEIISPRQIVALKDEWQKPTYEVFQERNLWSFYNATTEALKSCPPISIMEKHIQAHSLILEA